MELHDEAWLNSLIGVEPDPTAPWASTYVWGDSDEETPGDKVEDPQLEDRCQSVAVSSPLAANPAQVKPGPVPEHFGVYGKPYDAPKERPRGRLCTSCRSAIALEGEAFCSWECKREAEDACEPERGWGMVMPALAFDEEDGVELPKDPGEGLEESTEAPTASKSKKVIPIEEVSTSASEGGAVARRREAAKVKRAKQKANRGKAKDFKLKMESSSATSWEQAKVVLEATESDVLFVQEHRLLADRIPEASQWAWKRGWRSLWAPALATDKDGASGGVAIFVRSWLNLAKPPQDALDRAEWPTVLATARIVAGCLTIPGGRSVVLYSVYMQTGIGWNLKNKELMRISGKHAEGHKFETVMAGDWNMTPLQFRAGGCDRVGGFKVLAPEAATCISSTSARTIDFFVVSESLASVEVDLKVREEATTRPHRPVTLEIHEDLSKATVRCFKEYQRLPIERPFGPGLEPLDWSGVREETSRVAEAAREGQTGPAIKHLDTAFEAWLGHCELEVSRATDTPLLKPGDRSRGAQLKRVSVLKTRKELTVKDPSRAGVLTNLHQKTAEFACHLGRVGSKDGGDALKSFLKAADRLPESLKATGLGEVAKEEKAHLGNLVKAVAGSIRKGAFVESGAARRALNQFHMMLESLSKACLSQRKKEADLSNKKWLEWKARELKGAAAKAFKFSKMPEAWKPTESTNLDGCVVDTPADILQSERDKAAALWNAADEAPAINEDPAWIKPLPRITPQQMRQSAEKFKRRTGVHPDGVHVRQVLLLPDAALEGLADIMEVFEATGVLPAQQRCICVYLYPKPKEGVRHIGLYGFLYRIWARARQPLAGQWEQEHDLPSFAAAKNKSTTDAVWRQAVRNQRAKKDKKAIAQVIADFHKFYETVNLEDLVERAKKLGFPEVLVRAAVACYRMERVVLFEGKAAESAWPTTGIVAGDTLATALVKVYYHDAIKNLCARWPEAEIDIYIDDLSAVIRGEEEAVAAAMPELVRDIKEVIQGELKGKIAEKKTSLVANSKHLWDTINRRLGRPWEHMPEDQQLLGIDVLPGHFRRKVLGPKSKWAKRFAEGLKRKKRLARLRTGIRKTQKIFVGGIAPAMVYGAAVNGVSDKELLKLHRIAAYAYQPSVGGRSLTALWAVHGDPLWKPVTSAIQKWGQEVYLATNRTTKRAGILPVKELRDVWMEAAASVPKKWEKSEGPLHAAMLELRRIGWEAADPFVLVTDLEGKVKLAETPPKMLAKMLKDAVQRMHERNLAAKLNWGAEDQPERVCVDHVKALLSKKSKIDKEATLAALCAVTDAVWTGERARRAGYVVPDESLMCKLCGNAKDSVHHRLWWCPAVHTIRCRVAKCHHIESARKAGEDSVLYNRAIVKHPALRTKRISEGGVVCVHYDAEGKPKEDGQPRELLADGRPAIGGAFAYVDGSCDDNPVFELRRGSWAVCVTDQSGAKLASWRGPTWNPLPNTPQAGEHVALAAAAQVLSVKTVVYADCLGAARAFQQNETVRSLLQYAGVFRTVGMEREHSVEEVKWIRSHQAVGAETNPEDERHICGNNWADEEAKQACREQCQDMPDDILDELHEAQVVLKLMQELLPKWPPLGAIGDRLAGARKVTRTLEVGHDWVKVGKKWKCKMCAATSYSDPAHMKIAKSCKPLELRRKIMAAKSKKHVVALRRHMGAPLAFCQICGANSGTKYRSLLKYCPRRPTSAPGAYYLKRLIAGTHPCTRLPVERYPIGEVVPTLLGEHPEEAVFSKPQPVLGPAGSSAALPVTQEVVRPEAAGDEAPTDKVNAAGRSSRARPSTPRQLPERPVRLEDGRMAYPLGPGQTVRLGDAVAVGNEPGTVCYRGTTNFACGIWIGVELNRPIGKHSGKLKGIEYFACSPKCGVFVREDKCYMVEDQG